MRERLIGMAALVCAAWAAQAQETPQFAAVSVKECAAKESGAPSVSSPGTLSLGCYPLSRLISDAYWLFEHGRVETGRIGVFLPAEGLPDWADSARISIDAKTEGPVSAAMVRGPMMQRLLEERFHLGAHREAREGPAYVLTAPKGAAKLKESTPESCIDVDPSDFVTGRAGPPPNKRWCNEMHTVRKESKIEIDFRGVTMDSLVRRMNPGRPVVDRTGLTGRYDIHLTFNDDPAPGAQGGAASEPRDLSTFRAIREQLGLEIRPGTGIREYFVIDHIEHPSGN